MAKQAVNKVNISTRRIMAPQPSLKTNGGLPPIGAQGFTLPSRPNNSIGTPSNAQTPTPPPTVPDVS